MNQPVAFISALPSDCTFAPLIAAFFYYFFLLSFSLPVNNKLVSFFIFLQINCPFLDENQVEKWTKNRCLFFFSFLYFFIFFSFFLFIFFSFIFFIIFSFFSILFTFFFFFAIKLVERPKRIYKFSCTITKGLLSNPRKLHHKTC